MMKDENISHNNTYNLATGSTGDITSLPISLSRYKNEKTEIDTEIASIGEDILGSLD